MLTQLFLTIAIPTLLFAQTQFIWLQKKPGVVESGICVESSVKNKTKELYGKAQFDFTKKVPSSKCKIDDSLLSYIFMPATGRCIQGDTKTGGAKYFSYVDIKKCKTDKVEFKQLNINGKFGCYEIDSKSEGTNYYKKVKSSECLDEDSNLVWIPSSPKNGTCYSVNTEGTKKLVVKKSFCRPEKPVYNFVRTGPLKGLCLEQSTNEVNKYSLSVKLKNCRPSQTEYYFYKKPNQITGKCFEVDSETKGDNYIKQVSADDCKD